MCGCGNGQLALATAANSTKREVVGMIVSFLKGIVQPKMYILLSFSHSHVVPNLTFIFFSGT